LGMALPAAPPTGSREGVTQEDRLSAASRGSGAFRPARQPLELTSLATKKTLEGAPREAGPSRHSMTLSVSEQANRTMSKGFFGSMTLPWSTECRYKDPPGLRPM
jgi:hypothetical protein